MTSDRAALTIQAVRPMRELIFHVGPHKTGSTALQKYLYDNRHEISESGTYVPRIISPDNSLNSWYMVFVGACSTRRLATYHNAIRGSHDEAACADMQRRFAGALRSELQRASELGMERVILSTEEVAFFANDDWNSLYQILLQYFDNLSFYYYLRNPYERIASDLQQALKGGSVLRPEVFEQIGGQDLPRIVSMEPADDYRTRIRLYIRPYLYDRTKASEGGEGWNVISDFCGYTGIPLAGDLTRYSRVNARISAQMMSVVNDINQRIPAIQPNKVYNPIRHHIHNAIEAYRWTEFDTPFRFTSKDLRLLAPSQEEAKSKLISYCTQQDWITLIYDQIYEQKPDPLEDDRSSLEVSYELPQSYYVNALCHFWAYLRSIQLKIDSASRLVSGNAYTTSQEDTQVGPSLEAASPV
jgi:hypothetical protein